MRRWGGGKDEMRKEQIHSNKDLSYFLINSNGQNKILNFQNDKKQLQQYTFIKMFFVKLKFVFV